MLLKASKSIQDYLDFVAANFYSLSYQTVSDYLEILQTLEDKRVISTFYFSCDWESYEEIAISKKRLNILIEEQERNKWHWDIRKKEKKR